MTSRILVLVVLPAALTAWTCNPPPAPPTPPPGPLPTADGGKPAPPPPAPPTATVDAAQPLPAPPAPPDPYVLACATAGKLGCLPGLDPKCPGRIRAAVVAHLSARVTDAAVICTTAAKDLASVKKCGLFTCQ